MTLREIARRALVEQGMSMCDVNLACTIADLARPTDETDNIHIPANYEKAMIRLYKKRGYWTAADKAKWRAIIDKARGRDSFSA